MDAETVVREALAVAESGDMSNAGQYMTDDFKFSGPVPEPVGKAEFLGLQGGLIRAIPDWRFNAKNFKVQGNTVTFNVQITGTQTGTLDTHIPGMPAVPPTDKRISLPQETITVTMRGDKIATFDVTPVPGGGVMGILQQIGVPAMR